MASPNSYARDGAIDKDKDGNNGTDLLLDLSRNTLLVKGILMRTSSVGKTRRVEDADLGKWLLHAHDVHKHRHLPQCRSYS